MLRRLPGRESSLSLLTSAWLRVLHVYSFELTIAWLLILHIFSLELSLLTVAWLRILHIYSWNQRSGAKLRVEGRPLREAALLAMLRQVSILLYTMTYMP